MKAIWNGQVIAESDETVEVEGNQYFPPQHVNMSFFRPSSTNTVCGWKGVASYYSVVVDGKENKDAAWYDLCRSLWDIVSKSLLLTS